MIYGRRRIWQLINNGNIELSSKVLEEYQDAENEFVTPCNCDLLIGNECYISDSINNLSQQLLSLRLCRKVKIAPMGIMLFETDANFNIPENCAFRLSLRMSYIKKGLFMPNQPLGQPGYRGKLFGMLINFSAKPIEVSYRERMFTLEIVSIVDDELSGLEKPESTKGQGGKMRQFADESISSTFYKEFRNVQGMASNMKKQMSRYKKEVHRHTDFQMAMLSIGTLLLMIITIVVAVMIE